MENQEKKMSLVGHMKELRFRIFAVLIFFVITFIIGFFLTQPVIDFFRSSPAMENIEWNVFNVSDAIMIYMKFAFMIALVFTLPFILYQIWRFVAPGLTKKERSSTVWFIPIAFLLFVIGVSFAYFVVFPMIIQFLLGITELLDANEMFGMNQYFSFMFNLIIPFGLLFELPIIVVFLTRIGILSPKLLIRFRKIAYLILVIVGASITPPDLVSELLVIIPLIFLYEISIWLSKITLAFREKRMKDSYQDSEYIDIKKVSGTEEIQEDKNDDNNISE
ncbi:MAG: twin-arginine translocase subunit TatC [Vulcanibacillus sp.]